LRIWKEERQNPQRENLIGKMKDDNECKFNEMKDKSMIQIQTAKMRGPGPNESNESRRLLPGGMGDDKQDDCNNKSKQQFHH